MDDAIAQIDVQPAVAVPPVAVPAPRPPLAAGAQVAPIVPRTIEEVGRVADAIITAGMVPASYDGRDPRETKAKVMVGILKGLECGFGPVTALSTIAVINNRPSIYGDGAVALADRGGAVEWVKHWYEGAEGQDDWTAHYQIKRRGHAEPYTGKFSVKDAKRARLWGNPKRAPWMDYPQRMLLARARAYALREGFADFLMGLSIAEEAQDLPAPAESRADTSFLDDAPAPGQPAQPAAIEHKPEPALPTMPDITAATPVTDPKVDWAEVERVICGELSDAAARGPQAVGDVMRARVADYTNAPPLVLKRILAHDARMKAPQKGKR